MIIGTGIDIVEVGRIASLIGRSGDGFLHRWFSEEEIAYCSARARPALHFAARLAAKEALLKVLRPAWTGGILLREVSVVSGENGAPAVRLSGRTAALATEAGISTVHISLSHTNEYAIASVIATGDRWPHEPAPRG